MVYCISAKPFKKFNENHRLNLIKIAIEGEKNLNASNVEFKLPRPSYTINTLTYLKEKYPLREFVIVMGSDSFFNLSKWKNMEIIVKDYELYIYPRPGFNIQNQLKAKLKIITAPLLDISSTHIRKLIAERKSIRYLVTDSVKEEIDAHHYYKSASENPS